MTSPEDTNPPEQTRDAVPPVRALSRTERREKAVSDALRTLIRDLQMDQFGAAGLPADSELDMDLRVRVKPDDNWSLAFEPSLADQVLRHLQEAGATREAYHAGRCHCFRCQSSACEHSAPPSSLGVFKGYTATGVPEWTDLHQVFLEAKDERVDRLFAGKPDVLAMVQLGHGLKQAQLSSFGRASKTYSILGQVVAGYLLLPHRRSEPAAERRLALTFQIVETRGRDGAVQVRLNTLAGRMSAAEFEELLASDWEPWVYRARELAARALETIERRAASARVAGQPADVQSAMRRVPVVLRRLAEYLERGHRQGQRRTRHVEDRRQENRPVHKALDDAREAAAQSLYHDEKTHTWIVCGPQGRTHVFNDEGRHVTSLFLKPEAVAFRLRTRRWRPVTDGEAATLKDRLLLSSRHGGKDGEDHI